ncbi:hypothetical protein PR202_gb17598 [Eleusine coracana subsp. coracana]|uniref:DUF1677 family protein n=1 Tax=Eleusine coracana subsp. coracana TaxID=191504 RepID=A0AAV5F360_ELECO|nr:hypothetical protein PR202_gb17598 [Eleusine coracana subsp. coracana]
MEVEKARCECCGFTEECTPAYIAAVRAEHMGRWVCGLCAEAVGDEVVRRAGAGETITTAEALDRHVAFARATQHRQKAGRQGGGGRPRRRRREAAPAMPRLAARVARRAAAAAGQEGGRGVRRPRRRRRMKPSS